LINTRIQFVITLVAVLLPSALLSAEKPNIVFILADDMSYDSVSAYNPQIGPMKTPHIDRLIREGMSFTDAHSGSSVCTPTRYGLLTGRYCWRTRLKSSVLWEWGPPLIEPERLTVAELLQAEGYKTGIVGKWHLGWDWYDAEGNVANGDLELSDSFFKKGAAGERIRAVEEKIDLTRPMTGGPTDHGFENYFGDDVPNFPPYGWIQNDRLESDPSEMKPDEMFGHPGPMVPGWSLESVLPTLAEEAAAWIRGSSQEDRPFFLYLPLTSPHTPIAPSEEFQGRSGAGDYVDFVIETDAVVGRVLQALEESGAADETLLFFSTDNGTSGVADFPQLESHGIDLHYHYRGHKAQIHEGGHRVPFIVKWPDRIEARSTCDETICLNDFMATIADLLDVPLPNDSAEDSTSLLPLLTGEKIELSDHPMVVNHDIGGTFAIRDGAWKLVASGTPSLYNLEEDPKETQNVIGEHPEQAAEMRAVLDRYKNEGRSAQRL